MARLQFLLLEDNPIDAEVVRVMLLDGGIDCEVQQVDSRAEFVAALETSPFDLVLADYALPGFDGMSALEIVRTYYPDIPFIFVSAVLGEELAIESLKHGATDYVLKHRIERLVPCVRRALQEAQDQRDRQQAEAALRDSEARLAADLAAIRRLQQLSTGLVYKDDIDVMHEQILDAAIALMHADMASLYRFEPMQNELHLVASQGLPPATAQFWERVYTYSACSCGRALYTGERVIVPDIETCDFIRNSPDYSFYQLSKIRAVQTTLLLSRNGDHIGMLSTYWHHPHQPLERDLNLFDVLARQVADLIEQYQFETELEQILEREQAARLDAERANRIKDEFLAVLSHELRSPLNSILTWSQLLQMKTFDEAKVQQGLSIIESSVKLQTQLINDLLDVAKILHGKLELKMAPLNLASVIQSAVEVVKTEADAKSISLQLELNNTCQIQGDAARLQQIVWNLLSNAVKFTPNNGHVKVKLERIGEGQQDRVGVSAPTHASFNLPPSPIPSARITVTDTGRGIDSDFLPYIFQTFCQADTSTTRQYGGLGLGLAIVKDLVDAHGGIIMAESQGENQGTTFMVQFPLHPDAAMQPSTVSPAATEPELKGTRVLAVDDLEDARSTLVTTLAHYGADVKVVASAKEVLADLQTFKPDVLLCDISMPCMDGCDLIQRIRTLPTEHGGDIPAIAVTAYVHEEDRQRALACGFQQHVAKPFEPGVLVGAIAQLVRGWQRQQLCMEPQR